jgi:hypothetical protein
MRLRVMHVVAPTAVAGSSTRHQARIPVNVPVGVTRGVDR